MLKNQLLLMFVMKQANGLILVVFVVVIDDEIILPGTAACFHTGNNFVSSTA
jgi:hypothetical protein